MGLLGCAHCGWVMEEEYFTAHACAATREALEQRGAQEYQNAILEAEEKGAPLSALAGLRSRLGRLRSSRS